MSASPIPWQPLSPEELQRLLDNAKGQQQDSVPPAPTPEQTQQQPSAVGPLGMGQPGWLKGYLTDFIPTMVQNLNVQGQKLGPAMPNLVPPPMPQAEMRPTSNPIDDATKRALEVIQSNKGQGFGSTIANLFGIRTGGQRQVAGAYEALNRLTDLKNANTNEGLRQAQVENARPIPMPIDIKDASGNVLVPKGMMLAPAIAAGLVNNYNAQLTKLTEGAANRQSKLTLAQMQQKLKGGEVAKWIDVQDANGNPVKQGYNKDGQPVSGAVVDNAVFWQAAASVSSTVEYKQLDDGSIVALPKTTVSSKSLPGKAGAGGKGGRGVGPQASAPILGADNQPLIGKGGITSTTRTMVETAPKVIDLVDRIKGQITELQKSGDLGPGASRWNEAWSGKIGADNPRFRALMTNTTLLSTLLMRMHMGARGGQQIMEHFDQMIGAGHQSAANMLATMDEIGLYANDVKGAAPLPKDYGKSNQSPSGRKVVDFSDLKAK